MVARVCPVGSGMDQHEEQPHPRATIKAHPAPLHHPRPYRGTTREKDFYIALYFGPSPYALSANCAILLRNMTVSEGSMAAKPITENTQLYGNILAMLRENIDTESVDLMYLALPSCPGQKFILAIERYCWY